MNSKLYKDPIIGALFVSFISTFFITLNIYNGDLIKLLSKKDIVSENIEYMLWFLGPLLYLVFNYELSKYPLEYFVLILGILSNVYWNRYSPWKNDTDRTMLAVKDRSWENDKKITDIYVINNPRHRTEFYGTQFVLCSMLFIILVRRYDIIN